MDLLTILLFFLGGLAAGVINTLAGNGSAITLSLLIFTGMPANVANATNRIGALAQTLTAVLSLRRTTRTKVLLRDALWFLIPSVVGTVIGAVLAVDIDPQLLRRIIGVFMLSLLFTMLYKPSKWSGPTDLGRSKKNLRNGLIIFLIAVYGGFIQMGIGIMLLATLVLLARYSLRDANIVKLLLALVFVVPAFLVFAWSGDMEWLPGSMLAIGQALGAWFGARYILFLPRANQIVRWVLIIILSFSSLSLLGIPELIAHLFYA